MEDVIISRFKNQQEAVLAIEDLKDLGFHESEVKLLTPNSDEEQAEKLLSFGFRLEEIQDYINGFSLGDSLLIIQSSLDTEDDIREVIRANAGLDIRGNISESAKEGGPWPTQVTSYQHEISRGGFEADEDLET